MAFPTDLTGYQFGMLTAIQQSAQKATSGSMWECVCNCGNIVTVARSSLISGHTKSCGCKRIAFLQKNKPAHKHGGEATTGKNRRERLYMVWCGMKERCYSPSHNRYKDYGGRGISICEEWRNNYAAFRDWAMTNGYDPTAPRGACTIDRIDVNGNYCPENCRWIDMKTQAQNKRLHQI